MQLLLLSDIHGTLNGLQAIEPILGASDLTVMSGDITHFSGAEEAGRIIGAITRINPRLVAVSGNCDRAEVDTYLDEAGYGLHAQCRQHGGIDFVGASGSLPCPGSTPNELGESRFTAHLESALAQRASGTRPLVLVTHQPAYGTALDRTGSGGHAGSTALRDFIEREQPVLAVSGHIHEAAGVDRIGTCLLVNPGPFRAGRYACVEIHEDRAFARLEQA
jgi:Icc-related predicted phosphoesterase